MNSTACPGSTEAQNSELNEIVVRIYRQRKKREPFPPGLGFDEKKNQLRLK